MRSLYGGCQGHNASRFDGIVIRCPTCKDYEVAGGAALTRFKNASVEERAAALKKAKAFQSVAERPTITTTCL
jgi:hypothetical protein